MEATKLADNPENVAGVTEIKSSKATGMHTKAKNCCQERWNKVA